MNIPDFWLLSCQLSILGASLMVNTVVNVSLLSSIFLLMCIKTLLSSELQKWNFALVFMPFFTKFLVIKKLSNNLIFKNSLLRHVYGRCSREC